MTPGGVHSGQWSDKWLVVRTLADHLARWLVAALALLGVALAAGVLAP